MLYYDGHAIVILYYCHNVLCHIIDILLLFWAYCLSCYAHVMPTACHAAFHVHVWAYSDTSRTRVGQLIPFKT